MKTNYLILVIALLVVLGAGAYFLYPSFFGITPVAEQQTTTIPTGQTATTTEQASDGTRVLGTSVGGRAITSYSFGTGANEVLVVGGMHGGYSWNTTLLAYELIDYLKANPTMVPANVTLTVVPTLNPDGLYKIVGTDGRFVVGDITQTLAQTVPGRFNANNVDLNRNFDCDWKSTGTWQNTTVSGGAAAFSEPESLAIKTYVEQKKPKAAVVFFSAAGGVYSASCGGSVSTETTTLTNAYAKAAGYPAHTTFDAYATTGDMTNWFARQNIAAISVLLTDHTNTEWDRNWKGIEAVLQVYAQ